MKAIDVLRMRPGADSQQVGSVVTGAGPDRWKGYKSTAPAQGTINPGTSPIYGGGAITEMFFNETTAEFKLTITGATDSGWTTMTNTTDGKTMTRASRTSFSGGTWTWAAQTISQFFGLAGTKIVVFS